MPDWTVPRGWSPSTQPGTFDRPERRVIGGSALPHSGGRPRWPGAVASSDFLDWRGSRWCAALRWPGRNTTIRRWKVDAWLLRVRAHRLSNRVERWRRVAPPRWIADLCIWIVRRTRRLPRSGRRGATTKRPPISRRAQSVWCRIECSLPSGSRSTACGHDQGQVPVDMCAWYVLVTSASETSVFAVLGPYATRETAERKARDSRVVHYRIEAVAARADRSVSVRSAGSRTARPLAGR